jgi:drebrin-like protein
MSLQINLASRDLATAYQDVINANGIDWALFTYDKGSNDLKVQSTGSGGLDELEEEFSDGRSAYSYRTLYFTCTDEESSIQYAFARVIDPNVRS